MHGTVEVKALAGRLAPDLRAVCPSVTQLDGRRPWVVGVAGAGVDRSPQEIKSPRRAVGKNCCARASNCVPPIPDIY
jgi:hypothetical protein